METHKFKLLSGVDCEISKFVGKHQRLFTQKEFEKDSKGANMALADIIVKLGTKTNITEEDVSRMLSQDRKQILIQGRIFSLKRNKTFKFDYKYENEAGKMVTESMEMDVDAEDFETKPYSKQFESYEDIWKLLKTGKWSSITLEDCGKEVFFIPTDGLAENRLNTIPKKKRSSHSLINAHKPLYWESTDGKEGTLINLDLDKLSLDDIEDLRVAIKKEEGKQETRAIFESPETNQDEEVDVLTIPAFFFPSNAM